MWNHTGKLLEYMLMYATSVVIARSLGVQENGVFAGVVSLSQLMLVLSSFGLETSLNKHIPQLSSFHGPDQTRFILRKAVLLRVIIFSTVSMILVIVAEVKPAWIPVHMRDYLFFLIAYAGFRSLVSLFAIVLTAQLQTALTAKINLVIRGIELLLVLIVSRRGLLVDRLLIVLIFTGILHFGAYVFFARANWLGTVHEVSAWPIITFGGIFWTNTIVEYFLGRHGDILFLNALSLDSTQASIYDVGYSLLQLASMGLTVGFAGVTFATFARLAVDSRESMDRFYLFLVRAISLLTIPVYGFLLFNTLPVVELFYSHRYEAAANILQWMVLFRIVSRLFGGGENAEYLLSLGRVSVIAAMGVGAALVNILLDLLLIPSLGAMGAVIASGSANLLVNLLGAGVVYRSSHSSPQISFWVKLTIACCLASWLIYAARTFLDVTNLLVSILTYCALLLGLFMLVKPLTRSDLDWASRLDKRSVGFLRVFTQRPLNTVVRTT